MSIMNDVTNRVSAYMAIHGANEQVIDKVILCLDELLSNIHKYAYINQPDDKFFTIMMEYAKITEIFTLTLSDKSHEFNPFDIDYAGEPLDDIDDWQIGRLGMKLVKNMTKTHEYKRHNGENIVILQFGRE